MASSKVTFIAYSNYMHMVQHFVSDNETVFHNVLFWDLSLSTLSSEKITSTFVSLHNS